MKNSAWGGEDRYYGALQGYGESSRTTSAKALAHRLSDRFPDLADRIERAFRESNTLLRSHLRTETGLRLSTDGQQQSVPVRVVEGLPGPLAWINDIPPDLVDLYLDRYLFDQTSRGLSKLLQRYEFLETWPPASAALAPKDGIDAVKRTVDTLLAALAKKNPFEAIWDIEEDIFGAYFFRQSRIELYWIPIGLGAAALGIAPEALTRVVATHELAHAYTHLGYDIDDICWDTAAFAKADLSIVEGIAQFYTGAVSRRLKGRWPEMLDAYEMLLERQSGPYRAHLDWVDQDESGGEVVRFALVECRSTYVDSHDTFLDAIERHRAALGRRRRGQASQAPRGVGGLF